MSGFEILGLPGALDGLFNLSIKTYTLIHDARNAKKEQEDIKQKLDMLTTTVQKLRRDMRKAENDKRREMLFQNFLQVVNPNFLSDVEKNIHLMNQKMRPREGLRGYTYNAGWTFHKSSLNSTLSEIEKKFNELDRALHLDTKEVGVGNYEQAVQNYKIGLQICEEVRETRKVTGETKTVVESMRESGDREKEKKRRIKKSQEIANWVSKLDFQSRYREILEYRIKIDHQIFDSLAYRSWRDGREWILSCYADPGAGKTTLSAMIVENLALFFKEHFPTDTIPVLCIYCNHKEQDQQTPTNMVGSLLKQLILFNEPFCSQELEMKFDAKQQSRLEEKEICEALEKEIQTRKFKRVVVVVDALDESSDEVQRFFNNFYDQFSSKLISILITTRLDDSDEKAIDQLKNCDECAKGPFSHFYKCHDCPKEFDICEDCKPTYSTCSRDASHRFEYHLVHGDRVFQSIKPSEDNIKMYVRNELRKEASAAGSSRLNSALNLARRTSSTRFSRLCEQSSNLEQDVVDQICLRADLRFMLAKIYVKKIKDQSSIAQVRRVLQQLPQGYSDTYQSTMERIEENGRLEEARKILSWIVYSRRPLMMDELRHAIATDPDTGYSKDELLHPYTMLDDMAELIYVGSDKTVRLQHYTLEEYLKGDGHQWLESNFSTHIAHTCISYMSMKNLCVPFQGSVEEGFDARKIDYPFVQYAHEYWGYHARTAAEEEQESPGAEGLRQATVSLLQNVELVEILTQALWYLEGLDASRWEIRKGANGVHLAAWFGLTNVLSELAAKLDLNLADPGQMQTPLILAARRDHAETARELIRLGASVNESDAQGHTAIYEAAAGEHDEVMRALLVSDDIDLNRKYVWNLNRTILMIAIAGGSSTVELLLEKGVDVNHRDALGLTALLIACSKSSVQIVKRLIAFMDQLEINNATVTGRTALTTVVVATPPPSGPNLELDLTHMLLDMGASPDHKDNRGKSPAMLAVGKGKKHILEVIMAKTQSFDARDFEGRTLLHEAAKTGESDMARYLVTKGMDINVRDRHDRTPLHEAARFARQTIAEELISLNADRSLRDEWGRTPFEIAWQNGHASKMTALSPSAESESGFMSLSNPTKELLPLWSLVKLSDEALVAKRIKSPSGSQALLDAPRDPDTGDTLIHCAVKFGNIDMLQRLLKVAAPADRPALINATNYNGSTPLHNAISRRNLDLVTTLLRHHPRLDTKDIDQATPLLLDFLHTRTRGSVCGVALIAAGAAIDSKALIQPYFFAAIQCGDADAVKILIENHGALVQAKNGDGESPWQVAKANGHGEIMRFLQLS